MDRPVRVPMVGGELLTRLSTRLSSPLRPLTYLLVSNMKLSRPPRLHYRRCGGGSAPRSAASLPKGIRQHRAARFIRFCCVRPQTCVDAVAVTGCQTKVRWSKTPWGCQKLAASFADALQRTVLSCPIRLPLSVSPTRSISTPMSSLSPAASRRRDEVRARGDAKGR
jgi:hypothetical protein